MVTNIDEPNDYWDDDADLNILAKHKKKTNLNAKTNEDFENTKPNVTNELNSANEFEQENEKPDLG